MDEEQDISSDYRSARSGPAPRLIPCISTRRRTGPRRRAGRRVGRLYRHPETIAVLVREQRQRDPVQRACERGGTIRAVDREHIKPGQPSR